MDIGSCRGKIFGRHWMGVMLFLLLLLVYVLTGCGQRIRQADRETVGESGRGKGEEQDREQEVELVFIHNNPCEACDEEGSFREVLDEIFSDGGWQDIFEIRSYYAYQEDGRKLAGQAAEYFGLSEEEIRYPMVIAGNRCFLGYDQIMEELGGALPAIAETKEELFVPFEENGRSGGQERNNSGGMVFDAGEDVIHLLYFHTEICPKCEKAEAYLGQLPKQVEASGKEYPVVVTTLSVAEDKNALLFGDLAGQYDVPKGEQQVPILFIGEKYLSGEVRIRKDTLKLLESGVGIGAVYRMEGDLSETVIGQGQNTVLFFIKTMGVGFLNGFNPCALSLALLFFSLIAALPKGCLRYGLGFLTGKFLAYVLLGLAAAGAISFIPFETFVIFRKGLNAVLLAACLFLAYGNFRDCFYAFRGEYGKIKMQLPGKLRKWNDKLVKKMAGNSGRKAFLLLVFGGGMVIALGEFFCTGQIYLASILQWMQSAQNSGVPVTALVLYSAALCLPAFILLVLIVRGRSALFLVDRNLKGMPLVKLCNGILFVVFAVIALASM